MLDDGWGWREMEGNEKREALRSECQVGINRKSFLLICTSLLHQHRKRILKIKQIENRFCYF